jgi:hypothetical protein
MADLEKLIQGVPAGGIVRMFTPLPETWQQLQPWCAARNYGVVRRTEEYADWVGTVSYLTGADIVDIKVQQLPEMRLRQNAVDMNRYIV